MDAPALPAEFLAAADLLDESESVTAWRSEARPQQLPPDGEWFVWLIMAGRGWGKTRTGAEWLAHKARNVRGDYAVIARSSQDLRETCLEGQSGLLRALGLRFDSSEYNRATGQIRLTNGSNIYAYSAERPERARKSGAVWSGFQRCAAVRDRLARAKNGSVERRGMDFESR